MRAAIAGPAGMDSGGARAGGRPAAPRGPRRLHRLRNLVPCGADRRRGDPGARGRARSAAGPTSSSRSATRAGPSSRSRPRSAFDGPVWLITGKAESPIAELADEVFVVTPEIEKSWCHTASYTCAVAALAALRGDDVRGLPGLVERRALGARAGDGSLPIARGRRGPRLADGAGGGAEAPRGRLDRGRGAPHRAAPPRPPRRHRRDRPLLRPRGRGPRGRRARRRRWRRCGELGCETTLVPTSTRSRTSSASSS